MKIINYFFTLTIFLFISCDNNPTLYTDCTGETNGLSIEDNCGICDNNPTNDCIEDCSLTKQECCENNNGIWKSDDLNVSEEDKCCENYSGIWDDEEEECQGSTSFFEDNKCWSSYQCEGSISFWKDGKCWGGIAIEDCNGICGGNGILDCENTCINQDENGNYISQSMDCFGICNGTAVIDECNVCNGPGEAYLCGCSGLEPGKCDCAGNELDCNNECGGTATLDCNNECGGSAVEDECGVCGGNGAEDNFDCNGICIASGNNLDENGYDECEVCGGDNSCLGFDGCNLPVNHIYYTDGSVYYNVDFDFEGFQWNINGASVNSMIQSGGDAAYYGYMVQATGILIAINLTGTAIPAGCGVLTNLDLNGEPTEFTNIEFVDSPDNPFFVPEVFYGNTCQNCDD